MIDLKFVEQLLDLLNSTNAGSIEVRKNLFSTSIKVSKGTALENSGPVTYQVSAGNPGVAASPPLNADPPSSEASPDRAIPCGSTVLMPES